MKTTRSMTVTVGGDTVNFPEGTDVSDRPADVIQRLRRAGALPKPGLTTTTVVEDAVTEYDLATVNDWNKAKLVAYAKIEAIELASGDDKPTVLAKVKAAKGIAD